MVNNLNKKGQVSYKTPKFGKLKRGAIMSLLDLSTDYAITSSWYIAGDTYFALISTALIIISGVLLAVKTKRMFHSNAASFLALFGLSDIWLAREVNFLLAKTKTKSPSPDLDLRSLYQFEHDWKSLHLVQSVVENAPQALLQSFALVLTPSAFGGGPFGWNPLNLFSVTMSFLSLARGASCIYEVSWPLSISPNFGDLNPWSGLIGGSKKTKAGACKWLSVFAFMSRVISVSTVGYLMGTGWVPLIALIITGWPYVRVLDLLNDGPSVALYIVEICIPYVELRAGLASFWKIRSHNSSKAFGLSLYRAFELFGWYLIAQSASAKRTREEDEEAVSEGVETYEDALAAFSLVGAIATFLYMFLTFVSGLRYRMKPKIIYDGSVLDEPLAPRTTSSYDPFDHAYDNSSLVTSSPGRRHDASPQEPDVELQSMRNS